MGKAYLYINFCVFITLCMWACSGNKQENATNNHANFDLYQSFNQHFAPLSLPFQMETNNANFSVFTALLDENRHIDSTFRHIFVLDSLTQEAHPDSLTHHPIYECCKFYYVGKLFETANYSTLLYARNNLPPHDDIYIFLATMDKTGKKIDEILFHKPMASLPPTELKRVSIINADTSIMVNHVSLDYEFAKGKESMELKHKTLHEKYYTIAPNGKIQLVNQMTKEIPMDATQVK